MSISISTELSNLFGEKYHTPKVGRQGYALFVYLFEGRWEWQIETQNGYLICKSTRTYARRWDAIRSARRLSDKIAHVYEMSEDGIFRAI